MTEQVGTARGRGADFIQLQRFVAFILKDCGLEMIDQVNKAQEHVRSKTAATSHNCSD